MQELLQKVQEKIALEEELLELEQEKKRLKKEVFDLRIEANNEQVDVDRLEGFSLRSLALGLSGRKEERLEQERREARNAKAKFDFATARLAVVEQRLEEIPHALLELEGCSEQLYAHLPDGILQEKEHQLRHLTETLTMAESLEGLAPKLKDAANDLQSWIMADKRSNYNARKTYEAELVAQKLLDDCAAICCQIEPRLAEIDCARGFDAWERFDKTYLKDKTIGQFSRCSEVMADANNAEHVIRALKPTLKRSLRQQRIAFDKLLIEKAMA